MVDMDKLDDKEIEGIWKRVKKYVSTKRIKGKNQEEVLKNLESLMNNTYTSSTRGSMRDLIQKGFLGRLPKVSTIQSELIDYTLVEPKEAIEFKEEIKLPKVIGTTNPEKIAIKTGKGTRTYLRSNIRISYSTFKGRPSYYVYNMRTKERVTWGVAD